MSFQLINPSAESVTAGETSDWTAWSGGSLWLHAIENNGLPDGYTIDIEYSPNGVDSFGLIHVGQNISVPSLFNVPAGFYRVHVTSDEEDLDLAISYQRANC